MYLARQIFEFVISENSNNHNDNHNDNDNNNECLQSLQGN